MTTPPTVSQPQSDDTTPTDIKEILLGALPPLKAGIRVLKSTNPFKAAREETHTWWGTCVALGLIMVFAMLVILASDSAPNVNPWTSLWTLKFRLNVEPEFNWPVLLQCALYALSACIIGYLTSCLGGLQLSGGASATRTHAIRLAGYAALGAAFSYLVVLVLVLALGWVLYALNFRIFVYGWMTLAAVVVLPLTTWGIRKVFLRTPLPMKTSILTPLAISMATITSCALAAILIDDVLTDAWIKQGRTVNNIRGTPTAATVQACARASEDIVCAITLFPTKWQDYELIGDWKLGSVPKVDGKHQARFEWRPVKESEHQFARISLESQKDVTVEIRTAASVACKASGTTVIDDDRFFAVSGRILGVQQTAPQEMRVRIDNAASGFVDLMKDACLK